MDDVVVVSAARTPFSRFGGAMRDMSSVDLGAFVLREAVRRSGLTGQDVDEVYLGLAVPAEAALSMDVVARQAVLKAGFPPETVSLTVDRACCSGLAAIQLACRAIRCGDAGVVVAGGAENMGRAPHLAPGLRWGNRLGNVTLQDPLHPIGYAEFNPVAVDAGQVALEHGVDREEQDAWALRSQRLYARALAEGRFNDEIAPIEVPQRKGPPVVLDQDEFPRPDTTIDGLASLPTVYGSPTVTAGNAPGLDSGAAAVVLCSRSKAAELGIQPLATILCNASVAGNPYHIAAIPAPAIERALRLANLTLDKIDLIEINEAFAAMPLVASKLLARNDLESLPALREKINVNGGAVAVGHPLGASGARLLMTAMFELRRRGGGYGAVAICGGLGQGDAAIIRVG